MSAAVRSAVEDVLARYALGYDEGDLELLADCFTADAELSVHVADGAVTGPVRGRDAIVELVRGTARSQRDRRRHVLSNLVLEHAGDRARARNYLTLFVVADGALRAVTTGRYLAELRGAPDGAGGWRISNLRVELDLPFS
ncbi:nuclear transport factor 2 family protein [Saccharopolyspora sp. 6V]|uniref:nuclear transport factor 2 family protein n=1 Tax=Saccharopolyspora sp. 6V TaxID=2877239 RepID=UPI001CD4F91C|nr:nuclear transport factor 2 family protein [Saccharopolyspora sp. 6V]MCA1191537.1 nuclear transport factor 2 family protein [Saccharopolyspora sp. 6V]